jgi:hypothetical protein
MYAVHQGRFEVHVYEVKQLPPSTLQLPPWLCSAEALRAAAAAVRVLQAGWERKQLFVLRKAVGDRIFYCEVRRPAQSGRRAYQLALLTHTEQGIWEVYVLNFDAEHADCCRASLSWWRSAQDLSGHDPVVTALRTALSPPDVRKDRVHGNAAAEPEDCGVLCDSLL